MRADKSLVRIYLGTELIKTHPRVAQGKRSTDRDDYPEGKADYALRSVEALLAQAKSRGNHVGRLAEKLLGGPLPWTRMRQAYALVRPMTQPREGIPKESPNRVEAPGIEPTCTKAQPQCREAR